MTNQDISQQQNIGYRLLRIANDQFGVSPSELNAEQHREAATIAAKELLLEEAVLASPQAREVVVPQSQVKNAVKQLCDRYENEDSFYGALAENGLEEVDLEKSLARELKVEAVLGYVASKISPVDDTEVRLFYYMHSDRFTQPETRTARHILITINPDFPENTRESAEQRLKEIATRLQKDPRRFEEQALKHSECPTSLQGGTLGQITKGTLYPGLDVVLFAMKAGEISDLVESPLGLHVLFCEQIEPEKTLSYEAVKEKLRETLTDRQRKKHQKKWLKSLVENSAKKDTEAKENTA